ncbi:MAG: topoisomerase IV, partial [Ruminococcaceae bacterium]|nr:topoisomerase IV [Oscillospiraceae bacterium]
IAVGMASNICSFNLKEVCDTTIALLKDKNADIYKTLLAPDFSGGAQLIYNEADIRTIYETGRGSIKLRAKYSYDKKNNCIEITEIPYSTTVEAIIDKIVELVKQGKIKEISDIRDETDLSGLKVAIDLKRGTDSEKLMAKLYKQTPLQDTFSCNFNVLIDGSPKVLGVRELILSWADFRINCIKRRLQFDLDKKSKRLHLLMGLKQILLDIDKAVAIIKNTEAEADVVPNLMKGFNIDMIQAEFIAEIKLRHLNKEYILKRLEDIDKLNEEIADITRTLSSDSAVKRVIIKELTELSKKHGKDRMTEIVSSDSIETIEEDEFIPDYNVKLFMTEQNYVKKITLVSLRASAEQKLKDDDKMLYEAECSNKAEVLFFSNRQNVYKMKVHELPDRKASDFGEFLPNVLSMEQGEKIIYMVVTDKYEGNMLFAFENGKMAKIPLSAYATKTNRKRLTNAYSDKSPLADLCFLPEETELVALSNANKVLIFKTDKIALKTTRMSQGVAVLTPIKGSKLIKIQKLDEVTFTDFDYYRTKNIPARGAYLKDEDVPGEQLTLI